MAEFTDVLKNRNRMCKAIKCQECMLSRYNNSVDLSCDYFIIHRCEEAEKIIMKWVKEHPIKTNADKFKEVFGVELLNNEYCAGFACPRDKQCTECEYYRFWSREYKEN